MHVSDFDQLYYKYVMCMRVCEIKVRENQTTHSSLL